MQLFVTVRVDLVSLQVSTMMSCLKSTNIVDYISWTLTFSVLFIIVVERSEVVHVPSPETSNSGADNNSNIRQRCFSCPDTLCRKRLFFWPWCKYIYLFYVVLRRALSKKKRKRERRILCEIYFTCFFHIYFYMAESIYCWLFWCWHTFLFVFPTCNLVSVVLKIFSFPVFHFVKKRSSWKGELFLFFFIFIRRTVEIYFSLEV